jgi:hypothetical protein
VKSEENKGVSGWVSDRVRRNIKQVCVVVGRVGCIPDQNHVPARNLKKKKKKKKKKKGIRICP